MLIDELALASEATAPLSSRDIERLERARRLLLERMASPPGLPELARSVGLNDFKLKAGFRALFGTTVFALDSRATSASEPPKSRQARETVTLATSLVTPFFGAYYLESKVRGSSSFELVLNMSYLTVENGVWKTRAGTVGVGADYFFQGDALRGWYVEAIGEVWWVSRRHEPSGGAAPVLGCAGVALIGYQFVFHRGPVVDLGVGVVAFNLPSAHVEAGGASVSSEALTRVYPAAKVNVGWAF